MMDLLRKASGDLAAFLYENLPKISDNWWQKYVIDRLTSQQQRTATERGFTSTKQLDWAALLRVLHENWFELPQVRGWPREGRNWVKELQHGSNRWAHASTEEEPPADTYRDADTLVRVLRLIDADASTIERAEAERRRALAVMTPNAPAEPSVAPVSQKSLNYPENWREPELGPETATRGNAKTARIPTSSACAPSEERPVGIDKIRLWASKPASNVHRIIAIVVHHGPLSRRGLEAKIKQLAFSKNPGGAIASLMSNKGNSYGRVFREHGGLVSIHPEIDDAVRKHHWASE
jgi:hypothetical protein